ncbi:hypothetical protein GCM10018793_14700 [Streptomyces sulfonofaciens]|uniref:Integral membrane protein n=1 Tax=Streptomyces sulfonofaciens TaxID=68272 RepID=A0A919FYI4_9ACTN|nr:hypothetical protein [Streptomyces sulfonofaciens]GHH74161.1 hypothetical protein GCM10018793_14700 [Streptomyces sulfonofaciens]
MTTAHISETAPRALRAALFTALVVTLSSASHVLLSRVPLPPATLAATAAAVFATAYALAGRERGFAGIAGLLIPLELAADTLFTSGQHLCYGQAGGPVRGTLRSVGLDVLCGGPAVGGTLPGVAGEEGRAPALLAHADPASCWLLLAVHIGVGLLAAAWLRRGERALGQLLRAAVAATFRPLLVAVAAAMPHRAPARRLPRPAHRPQGPGARAWVHSVGRRGPPCSAVFA